MRVKGSSILDAAVSTQVLQGEQILPWLDALAQLRLRVFAEWPYLYQGDAAYEAEYLSVYARSAGSVIVLARAGGQVVGCSSAIPLVDEQPAFRQPLEQAGYRAEQVYYFGESVLLPAWRGRGLGHAFFDARESAAARDRAVTTTCFCAVQRPADDPRRPADYRPLDAFWRKRGYQPRPDLVAEFDWQEIGEPGLQRHRLMYWVRGLRDAGKGPRAQGPGPSGD